ncbi:MAG: rhodanese-like domain-containing protein [Saprospiraceae bacterium]
MNNHKEFKNKNADYNKLCGIQRWQQHKATLNNLNFNEFVRAGNQDKKSMFIDVRTSDEYKTGTIEGAINIDYLSTTLIDDLDILSKKYTYYIFCRTGRRSLRVCMLIKNMGINVYNLDGGIISKEATVQ